jgi:dihydrodipicolinate synthase/N-acetylneuraminate lyase
VVSELGIPAIKYAMDLNGYYGGLPRSPLLSPTQNQKAEIEALMNSFRN